MATKKKINKRKLWQMLFHAVGWALIMGVIPYWVVGAPLLLISVMAFCAFVIGGLTVPPLKGVDESTTLALQENHYDNQ